MNGEVEEEVLELEEQFILRLPLPEASLVRKLLKKPKPKKFRKCLKISLNEDNRTGTVFVKQQQLQTKLVDLPCIVESVKTSDKVTLFKTANISQMMICQKQELDENNNSTKIEEHSFLYPHGVAPSLKNVRRRRFRKIMRKEGDLEDNVEIEKEVIRLLRADNEAVSTRFEFFYEEVKPTSVNEYTLFGEISTDSDSEKENDQDCQEEHSDDTNKESIE